MVYAHHPCTILVTCWSTAGQQLQILALKKVYQKLQALQHSVLLNAGAGLQGPAGVRTEGPPGDDEPMTAHGDVDLEPGAAERPEGIVGPSGLYALLVFVSFLCMCMLCLRLCVLSMCECVRLLCAAWFCICCVCMTAYAS